MVIHDFISTSDHAISDPAIEYCAPVWSRSPHVKTVDDAINSSLLTIPRYFKPTPVFQSHILAWISPAGLRLKASTLALARNAVKHDWHILHDTTNNEVPPCKLKSRQPYNKEDEEMLSDISEDRSKDAWIEHRGSRSGKHPDHPSRPPLIGPRRRCQGRRSE